jgi:hypothetical protein
MGAEIKGKLNKVYFQRGKDTPLLNLRHGLRLCQIDS